VLRSRGQASGDSISDFNHRLDTLGRTNGNIAYEPRVAAPVGSPAAARRRRATIVLASAVFATGLIALATNAPAAWALNLLADLAFVAFLALWAWARSVLAEQTLKVRELPDRQQTRDFALRRAASS
jgi:hypothetical protein